MSANYTPVTPRRTQCVHRSWQAKSYTLDAYKVEKKREKKRKKEKKREKREKNMKIHERYIRWSV